MIEELKGKTAIVTGSGRHTGLGKAIAMRLAEAGCNLVVADLGAAKGPHFPADAIGSTAEMEEIVAEIRAKGVDAIAAPCDVRDPESVERLVNAAVDRFGSLDVMVNNAGVGYIMKAIVDMEEREWDAVLDVNLKGVFLGVKYAAIQMIKQGRGGKIVNVASQAAKSAFPFASAYTSSKHGLVGLTRVAAIELGQHGIHVNAVCPNHITTGLGAWQNEFFREKFGKSLDEYLGDIRARIPLGRIGVQDDIAKAAVFFCTDMAGFVTGECMNVSGGEEMH